jgi:serine protease Do
VRADLSTPLGDLLSQYTRVRITDMTNIDIGLFDYDRHNALYYFILNADEQVYMRFGGRDARGPNVYYNLDSFQLALQKGLDQHGLYENGKLQKSSRPPARFPRDIPLLQKRIIKWGRCVECHLIDDYDLQEREKAGTLDRRRDMFRFPDIRRIGIDLDIPKGLEVNHATGPAQEAGMLPGDLIIGIADQPVLTFADLQYEYNKVDRDAKQVAIKVERGGKQISLSIGLPPEWWWTDLYYRFLTIEPLVYFENRPLTTKEKASLGLDPAGFASEVVKIDPSADALGIHKLELGDIVFEVDGITKDPQIQNCRLYMKLTKRAGDVIHVKVLRDGKIMDRQINSERQFYRKESE